MLTEICAEIKNYFAYDPDIHTGKFRIVNGQILPRLDYPTDYIRIVGSHRNDGVHKLSDNDLEDEGEFDGGVWIMSPPKSFLALAQEIATWQENNGKADSVAMSPFNSESFGGYSYSKGVASSADGTGAATWQGAFANRLKLYRKIRVI